MVSKGNMKKAVDAYIKNPTWKAYYNGAPSETCKEFIALEFCYSLDIDADAALKQSKALESKLSKEDWAHLYKYAGNTPFAAKCKKNMK